MIRLEIDGREVSLAADASFDIEYKNPFFTKEGEMTYDIDIYLDAGNNAVLYGHLDRDTVTVRPEGRRAVLYDGPRVLVSGKEIVLSVEDGVAKVQILGDNSELNYLAGGDTSIRDMDFGEMLNKYENPEDFSPVSSLKGLYPDSVYNYSTFVSSDNTVFNQFYRNQGGDLVPNLESYSWVKQPFFLYYVEKLIELLGYTLHENDLRETEAWKRLLVTNEIPTDKFQDLLPDWTADEFLTEIESFFNCVFVVRPESKSVDIKYVKSFYESRPKVELNRVLDKRSIEFDDTSDNLYLTYKNVEYDLPDKDVYKYLDLKDDVRSNCEIYYVNDLSELRQLNLSEFYDKYCLFFVNDIRQYFIVMKREDGTYYPKMADYLRALNDSSSKDSCELKIVPSPITNLVYGVNAVSQQITVPISFNMTEKADKKGFQDAIKSGMGDTKGPDRIYVSFYLGVINSFDEYGGRVDYALPQSATQPFHSANGFLLNHADVIHASLSLVEERYGMYDQFYQGNENIDTSKRCTFTFVSEKILDPKDYFLIHGKLYYCKVLKYKVEDGELGKLVEGEFFPVE